jgi:hypothetical protein
VPAVCPLRPRAANDFEALERLRKLAIAETVPAPKIPQQIPLELASGSQESGEDGDAPGPVQPGWRNLAHCGIPRVWPTGPP